MPMGPSRNRMAVSGSPSQSTIASDMASHLLSPEGGKCRPLMYSAHSAETQIPALFGLPG